MKRFKQDDPLEKDRVKFEKVGLKVVIETNGYQPELDGLEIEVKE